MKTIPITTTQTRLVPFGQNQTNLCYEVGREVFLTLVVILKEPLDARLEIVLADEGANAVIVGVVMGKGEDVINLKTYQHHKAPHTTSDLLIKSVINDSSTFSYEGVIKVAPGAQQTNAYQRNDSLMLSPHAHANTKPALEILADDVRCTHGATIGKIDSEQLFYLESHGITQKVAEEIIIEGFLLSVTDRITNEEMQNKMAQKIKEYL